MGEFKVCVGLGYRNDWPKTIQFKTKSIEKEEWSRQWAVDLSALCIRFTTQHVAWCFVRKTASSVAISHDLVNLNRCYLKNLKRY